MTPRLFIVIVIIVLLTGYALAEPLPVPKPPGPGGSCPHGWLSSGSYCVLSNLDGEQRKRAGAGSACSI